MPAVSNAVGEIQRNQWAILNPVNHKPIHLAADETIKKARNGAPIFCGVIWVRRLSRVGYTFSLYKTVRRVRIAASLLASR